MVALGLLVAGFWLAHKSNAALEPGVLSAKVDQLVAGWTAQNTPAANRVVDLIISDARSATASEENAEARATAYSSEEMAVLDSAKEPSFGAKLSTWFRRTFFRRNMSAAENTAFVEALATKPTAATWTHQGEETASEDEMIREFMRAILKADAAGAQVNIITQGRAAAIALKAVKTLKNAKRTGGGIVTVNKIIAVDMNRPTLKRINSAFFSNFSKPENLRELVYIWHPPAEPKKTAIEIFSPKYNGIQFDGDTLFPMMGGGKATTAQYIIQLVQVMVKQAYAMQQVIAALSGKAEERKAADIAKADEEKKWSAPVVKRDLKGRAYNTDSPGEEPQGSKPQDSLSALIAGQKEDSPKPEKPAQNQTKKAEGYKGTPANCKGDRPSCNWYDAKAYCGGRLPTVNRLKALYSKQCPSGGCWGTYWSSEEVRDGREARDVDFSHDALSGTSGKSDKRFVDCAREK